MQDNSRSVRLRIPYRLHLGFYRYRDLPYLFGSTGVAVREPYLIMRVSRTEGGLTLRTPTAESEKIIAGTLRELNIEEGLSVEISGFLRHHVGLGSRTKLVIGLLKSLKILGYVRENNPIDHLAKKLGVGRVSGIGIYTFLYGGFVADTGVFRGNGVLTQCFSYYRGFLARVYAALILTEVLASKQLYSRQSLTKKPEITYSYRGY